MTKSQVPQDAPIFHITHVDNLAGILREGGLWSDGQRIARKLASTNIGHLHIKQRRLNRPVMTRGGGKLGDYVPFNFCPRSVMLYAVAQGHDDYKGGQADILHLVSRVSVATNLGGTWAFTDRHAELAHALHYDDLEQLSEVPWQVMRKKYWTEAKEERQAEFLVHEFFPWTGVTEIGVIDKPAATKVQQALAAADHRPPVTAQPKWYY